MSRHDPANVTDRRSWRRQHVEEILAPEQVICDPHHHLWGHAGDVYFAAELAEDIGDGHKVEKTIYVECGSDYRQSGPSELAPVGETEFVVNQDQQLKDIVGHSVIQGIIGFADLKLGRGVQAVLDAHKEAAEGRFVGVRHALACDPSPKIEDHNTNPPADLMSNPQFIEGLRTLGQEDLTFDAWLYHPQLDLLAQLAAKVPDTTVVCDHLGAPIGIGPYAGRREEIFDHCRSALSALAQCPNSRLKLGGIGMPLYGNGWHRLPQPPDSKTIAAGWQDHIRWCIDTFGPERVMFESNFPPDGRSCSYRTLWNAFKRIAEPYSAAERQLMFHDTAIAVYRL